jgi:hypothetical protein
MDFRPNNINRREQIDRIQQERDNLIQQMQQQSQSTLNRTRPSQPKCNASQNAAAITKENTE